MDKENKEILNDLTVLFVDDDTSTRKSMVKILSNFFKEVYSGKNGKEGFELFESKSPDILISDMIMPIIDGITLSKMIRETGSNIPILIVSAHNVQNYEAYKDRLSLFGLLKKPYTIKQFEETLIKLGQLCQK